MITSPVLIAAAVPEELASFRNRMDKPSAFPIGGREAVSGYIGEVPVRILTTGPGQVNAVQALTAAIEGERPALILQTGCAAPLCSPDWE